jgi:short-subunit dehydrogenase
MDTEMNYALITGGSRGIGNAIARECAGRGMNLLLVAKREEGLKTAAMELKEEFQVEVHYFAVDLREPDGPQSVWAWCQAEGYRVNILVNNAGKAGTFKFQESTPEYSDERILVNVRAVVLLTHHFLAELKSHPRAYILNIGSLSAYFPIAYKSVYSSSKAFILNFSRALKQELKGSSVSITVINPNGVRTNADTHTRIDTHSKLSTRLFIKDSAEIARIAVGTMLKGRLVAVPGVTNRFLVMLSRIIPKGMRDRLAARIFSSELSDK